MVTLLFDLFFDEIVRFWCGRVANVGIASVDVIFEGVCVSVRLTMCHDYEGCGSKNEEK